MPLASIDKVFLTLSLFFSRPHFFRMDRGWLGITVALYTLAHQCSFVMGADASTVILIKDRPASIPSPNYQPTIAPPHHYRAFPPMNPFEGIPTEPYYEVSSPYYNGVNQGKYEGVSSHTLHYNRAYLPYIHHGVPSPFYGLSPPSNHEEEESHLLHHYRRTGYDGLLHHYHHVPVHHSIYESHFPSKSSGIILHSHHHSKYHLPLHHSVYGGHHFPSNPNGIVVPKIKSKTTNIHHNIFLPHHNYNLVHPSLGDENEQSGEHTINSSKDIPSSESDDDDISNDESEYERNVSSNELESDESGHDSFEYGNESDLANESDESSNDNSEYEREPDSHERRPDSHEREPDSHEHSNEWEIEDDSSSTDILEYENGSHSYGNESNPEYITGLVPNLDWDYARTSDSPYDSEYPKRTLNPKDDMRVDRQNVDKPCSSSDPGHQSTYHSGGTYYNQDDSERGYNDDGYEYQLGYERGSAFNKGLGYQRRPGSTYGLGYEGRAALNNNRRGLHSSYHTGYKSHSPVLGLVIGGPYPYYKSTHPSPYYKPAHTNVYQNAPHSHNYKSTQWYRTGGCL